MREIGKGLTNAVQAFLLGENERVLEILAAGDVAPVDAGLLRARTFLRMRNENGAIEELKRISAPKLSLDQRFARDMLLATARFRAGSRREALRELTELAQEASGSSRLHPTVRSEVAYFYALALWGERLLPEAREIALNAIDPAGDIVYVRLLELLGWIEISQGNVTLAARHFATGLAAFRSCTHQDASVKSALVHGAIVLAVETLDASLIKIARAEAELVHWGDADRWREAQVQTYLGRLSELEGANVQAWQHFERAKHLDVKPPYRAIAMIAQANLLWHVGERFAAARMLDDTWGILSGVTWSQTNAEERVALLAFAFSAAQSDVAAASQALTKARSIWEKDDPLIAFSRDDRVEAMLRQAAGAIHAARNEVRKAVNDLRSAYEIWIRFDYRTHAVRVAQILWQLTQDLAYRQYIESISTVMPSAWFAKSEGNPQANDILEKLSQAELRVLRSLLRGDQPKKIAAEFGRSIFTIRNQVKKVFLAFGVHSRSALVVASARIGIIGDDVVDAAISRDPDSVPKTRAVEH
jgi:DNA-binding NarL/FixJ family response regulator